MAKALNVTFISKSHQKANIYVDDIKNEYMKAKKNVSLCSDIEEKQYWQGVAETCLYFLNAKGFEVIGG